MNHWPWYRQENSQSKTDEINEKLKEIKEEIQEYFGTTVFESIWLDKFLTKDFLLLGGFKYIVKYAKCENCDHYVGPNSILRKIYNIPILNAYCERHYDKTKPDFVCGSIAFQIFWKQILEHKSKILGKYNFPPSPLFIELGLDRPIPSKYKKTHTRIPELWEYQ
jgi:hypothetical protein